MAQQPNLSSLRSSDTWREIERLIDEVAALARQHTAVVEFYTAVLHRAMQALVAERGFVWIPEGDGRLVLACQAGGDDLDESAGIRKHAQLAATASSLSEPTVLAFDDDEPDKVLFCPVVHAGRTAAVMELLLPRGMVDRGQQNCIDVLQAMCELATDFHHRLLVSQHDRTRHQYQQFEAFADRLHQSLDWNVVSLTLANDGRQIAACDRLSVLLVRGSRCQILAVSGVDAVDRRSRLAESLEAFARRCITQGEPLWYHGNFEDMPPQLQTSLQDYLDVSHARRLGALPLRLEPQGDSDRGRVLGLLVGEDFHAQRERDEFEHLLQRIGRPATTALNNAVEYHTVPLLTTFARLTRARWFFQAGRWPKTVLALSSLIICLIALFLIPTDFTVSARGTLQPKMRRHLFSPEDGVVVQVKVEHGQQVTRGQPLLRLQKPELELKLAEVVGDRQTTQQLLQAAGGRRHLAGNSRTASADDRNQLAAEQESLKERVANLLEQEKILQERISSLQISSPIAGQVMTWNVAQRLTGRPVVRGAELLTIAEPGGPWELELEVDDRNVQHLLQARQRQRSALSVTYRLASRSQTTYRGSLAAVAVRSEVSDGRDKPTVAVTVEIQPVDAKSLVPGAEVVARIDCGRRSLGYVLLRDIWEAIQLYVLF